MNEKKKVGYVLITIEENEWLRYVIMSEVVYEAYEITNQ